MSTVWRAALLVVLLGLLCFPSFDSASALTTIDFGPAFGAPPNDIVLTDQLKQFGVVFSTTSPNGVEWHGAGPLVASFPFTISAGFTPAGFGDTSPIRIDFVDPATGLPTTATSVSIFGFDGGGDLDILILKAFDQAGALLTSATFGPDSFGGGHTLTVTHAGIAFVVLETTNTQSGLFFTDLIFQLASPANPAQTLHNAVDTLATLNLFDQGGQTLAQNATHTALESANLLAGGLISKLFQIPRENLVQLGLDIFRVVTALVNGVAHPLIPFGPLFVCPPQFVVCGLQGEGQGFRASAWELFAWSLAFHINGGDAGLFSVGDVYVVSSPALGFRPAFGIASVVGISPISPSGLATVTFRFEGISALPEIDIKPRVFPNTIKRGQERVTIAILSTATFDAIREIDSSSLTFGRTGNERSLERCIKRGRDVNGDKLVDLVCSFDVSDAGFFVGDIKGILKGRTVSGSPFISTDAIQVVRRKHR